MHVGFGTGRALSSEKRIRAPIASSDDCLVAHAINRSLSPIVRSALNSTKPTETWPIQTQDSDHAGSS